MYAGTFDPPTVAHIAIMEGLIRDRGFAKLVVVVNEDGSGKAYKCSAWQRREMILRGLAPDVAKHIDVRIEPSSGKNTLFDKLHGRGDYDWIGIIGQDSFGELPAAVRERRRWLVFDRAGAAAVPSAANVERASIDLVGVSSSKVRTLLEAGGDARGLLCPGVAEYIVRNGLYVAPRGIELVQRERAFHSLWTLLAGARAALEPPPFVATQAPQEMANYIRRYLEGRVRPH